MMTNDRRLETVLEPVTPEALLSGCRSDLARLELAAGGALFAGVMSRALVAWCLSTGTLPAGVPGAEGLLVHRGVRLARRMAERAAAEPVAEGLDPRQRRGVREARILSAFLLALAAGAGEAGRFEIRREEAEGAGEVLPPGELLMRFVTEAAGSRARVVARRLPPARQARPGVWERAMLSRLLEGSPVLGDVLDGTLPSGLERATRGRRGILEQLADGVPAAAAGLEPDEAQEARLLEAWLDSGRERLLLEDRTAREALGAAGADDGPDTTGRFTRALHALVLAGGIDVIDGLSGRTVACGRAVRRAAAEAGPGRRKDGAEEAPDRPRLWFAADAVLLEWPAAAPALLEEFGARRPALVPPGLEDEGVLVACLDREGLLDSRVPAGACPLELPDDAAGTDGTGPVRALLLRPTRALLAAAATALGRLDAETSERAGAFGAVVPDASGGRKRIVRRMAEPLLRPGVLPEAGTEGAAFVPSGPARGAERFAWRLSLPWSADGGSDGEAARVLAAVESLLNAEPLPEAAAVDGTGGVAVTAGMLRRHLIRTDARPGGFLHDPQALLEGVVRVLGPRGILAADEAGGFMRLVRPVRAGRMPDGGPPGLFDGEPAPQETGGEAEEAVVVSARCARPVMLRRPEGRNRNGADGVVGTDRPWPAGGLEVLRLERVPPAGERSEGVPGRRK